MSRYALGCIIDGFSGPESLNQRSLVVLQKTVALYKQLTKAGHYVEIWIPKWKLFYPNWQTPLYQLVYAALMTHGIPSSCIYVIDQLAYNTLSDGAALANCASVRHMDYHLFVVQNFHHYFLMTYKAMRKYAGDGQDWQNISVISSDCKNSLKAILIYSVLTLITAIVSQNKWLWKYWFIFRARDKARREKGFVCTG